MSNQTSEHIMNDRLRYLFERYMGGGITVAEEQELAELSLVPGNEQAIAALQQEFWDKEDNVALTTEETNHYLNRIFNREPEPAKVRRLGWRKIAVAASIILALGTIGYFAWYKKETKPGTEVAKATDVKPPETNRAMVTLATGETVYLDNAANGQLTKQGNVELVKLANGQIVYQTSSGDIIKELQYNTLTNPKGSKVIDMTLADGSRVWLNAGSSVTYPIAFIGNERKVTITGEAYFEVAADKTKPFKVTKGEMAVEVLGTHFNVNAYDDEADIKVTLLEGSVNVSSNQRSLTIKPNQQAVVTSSDVILNTSVNVEAVMAWKNGRFQFEGYSIEQVLRQIEKWYDVEVVYEAKPQDQHFGGGISRNVEVSKVLNMLETTEAVHFRIEGRKIIVVK